LIPVAVPHGNINDRHQTLCVRFVHGRLPTWGGLVFTLSILANQPANKQHGTDHHHNNQTCMQQTNRQTSRSAKQLTNRRVGKVFDLGRCGTHGKQTSNHCMRGSSMDVCQHWAVWRFTCQCLPANQQTPSKELTTNSPTNPSFKQRARKQLQPTNTQAHQFAHQPTHMSGSGV